MNKQKIKLYASPTCADCHRSTHLLDKEGVDYEYINIQEVPGAAEKVMEINNGFQSTPTIVFPSGKILVEPSSEELLAAIKKI